MKQLSLVLVAVVAVAVVLAGGCARSPWAEHPSKVPDLVDLPAGFAPLKGLTEADYIDGLPRYIVCTKDGSIMALVSTDKYSMGSPGQPNESPAHTVKVESFYIDICEVNNAQFARFAKAIKCIFHAKDHPYLADTLLSSETSRCWSCRNWQASFAESIKSHPAQLATHVQIEPDHFKDHWTAGVNDSHPARAVNFWEAWYYCRWVGKDLPTEAEWELAAKGATKRIFPWGNIEPDSQHVLCNYSGERPSEDGYEYTAPVTAFEAGRSTYGCYNMAGNVWEWCKDRYDATIYSAERTAAARGQSGKAKKAERTRQRTNPQGPILGEKRVIRGGAFTSDIYNCRTTGREASKPNVHAPNIGFRGILRIR